MTHKCVIFNNGVRIEIKLTDLPKAKDNKVVRIVRIKS
jgi:hypothetical protein